ncbi:agglutinin biogenesis protein MshI|uniref:agglutinin biogenesis protein MshI n=1 Tax=Noviherbaspirillum sp. L7-7A TaxID=2850560 RepID=UPI001C2C7C51|nr:agglutinin biogenesis protein MshI [Noviherbaspirillum sp. L7-7A]MBV0878142.1 agglutinin biogenesis protein MshI [Noviherbaspirillum sp. L7-7A]
MFRLRKTKEMDGWRAVTFQAGEVRAAHVYRPAGAAPVVAMIASEMDQSNAPSEALARLARNWQGQRHACTTALNAADYHFLPVEAPNVPATELKSAIAWTVASMIDINKEENTIDVLSIPSSKETTQRARGMYAVVAHTELANEYHRHFQAARLTLKAIDIPEMAQRNLAALLENEGHAAGLISFDTTGSLLTITSGGELCLARRLDLTADQIGHPDPAVRAHHHERVALEIQRSLDHFNRQFNWTTVSLLAVAPFGDDDGGLVTFLADNLDTRVEPFRLDKVLDISRVPELKDLTTQHRFLLALGLALRHEEKAL